MENIAVVVLDTLRRDAFEQEFEWLPGRRFDNAHSTTHWTAAAHASLFGGKYPSELGVHAKSLSLDCEQLVLAERLREAGYTTRGFSCNSGISEYLGFDRGFEEFDGSWRVRQMLDGYVNWFDMLYGESSKSHWRKVLAGVRESLSAQHTLDSLKLYLIAEFRNHKLGYRSGLDSGAKSALRNVRNTNFGDDEFYFLNLMEAHHPYAPPLAYQTVGEPKECDFPAYTLTDDTEYADHLRQAYDDSVRYLSDMYRRIFEELRVDFDYIITLGDHGELFGEFGVWGHWHGLYPELTNIPLTVWSGEESIERYDETVSLLDIHRTVLELAGLKSNGRGQNLFDDVSSGQYLTEYLGVSTEQKRDQIEAEYGREIAERYEAPLYGLATADSYYGFETVNGFVENESTVDTPRETIESMVGQLDVERAELDQSDELSSETLSHLEDLGYA